MKKILNYLAVLIFAMILLNGCTSRATGQTNASAETSLKNEKNLTPPAPLVQQISNNTTPELEIKNVSEQKFNRTYENTGYENKTLEPKKQSELWEPGTKWINISAANGRQIKAAVVWPNGTGPFPVIIFFHGSDGFRQADLYLAQDFSRKGFIVVTGCWFSGDYAPYHPSDVISCPRGLVFNGANLEAAKNIGPLIAAAKNLPGAKADSIGLIGSSRGSTLSLLIASTTNEIKAVVSVSAIYSQKKEMMGQSYDDTLPISLVQNLNAPVLILHSKADNLVNIQEAYDYEAKLKQLGKTYESYYYEDAPHTLLFVPPAEEDARERAGRFFIKNLK